MPLTFPGAEAWVESIHERLRNKYKGVPGCLNISDESAGDFGIAHFLGLDSRTIRPDDYWLTFDNDRIPAEYVVAHEVGHSLSLNAQLARGGSNFDNGIYDGFWAARGFPGTPWEGQNEAIRLERVYGTNKGYQYWVEENFADAFGAVNTYGQGTLITRIDAYLDEPKLRAFYATLEGLYSVSDEDIAKIVAGVTAAVLPHLLTKIDSMANLTMTVQHRRVAHGKDPFTGNPGIEDA